MARPPVPGPIVIPNAVEVKLHWSRNGNSFSNVLHGSYTGTPALSSTFAESLFSGFKSGLTSSAFNAELSTDTSFDAVEVKDLRSANMAGFLSTGPAVTGTDATGDLADSLAIVVTLKTAQSGRGFRGRVYLGGLGAIAQGSSRDSTAQAGAAAAAFVSAIMGTMQTNSVPMVVAQRALQAGTDHAGNPLPARTANTVAVTDAVIVSARLDSQRRRMGR
jgi:hypothetical protein